MKISDVSRRICFLRNQIETESGYVEVHRAVGPWFEFQQGGRHIARNDARTRAPSAREMLRALRFHAAPSPKTTATGTRLRAPPSSTGINSVPVGVYLGSAPPIQTLQLLPGSPTSGSTTTNEAREVVRAVGYRDTTPAACGPPVFDGRARPSLSCTHLLPQGAEAGDTASRRMWRAHTAPAKAAPGASVCSCWC
jgi:hypothetical protein